MAKKCQISGKSRQTGNRVSHANNRTPHVFHPNIQKKRFFIASLGKKVSLKLSTHMLKTIDKLGIEATLKKFGVSIKDLAA